MNTEVPASPDLRAAISSFLNENKKSSRPFALSHAMEAVRRIFPDVAISDADLADAITSEALTAGMDMEFDVPSLKGKSLERWDNEGGATGS